MKFSITVVTHSLPVIARIHSGTSSDQLGAKLLSIFLKEADSGDEEVQSDEATF